MGFELRKTLSPQNFHLNEKLSRKKSHSQRMSLFLLNLNILDEKCPIPRAFDKKKKKISSNSLTSQMTIVTIRIDANERLA